MFQELFEFSLTKFSNYRYFLSSWTLQSSFFCFLSPSIKFSLASSILNPLIFAYYNKAFREDLQAIFCGKSKISCCTENNCKEAPSLVIINVSAGVDMTNLSGEYDTKL